MTNPGYFLTAKDYGELEAISIRLAHFASIVFDQAIDFDATEDDQADLLQERADAQLTGL